MHITKPVVGTPGWGPTLNTALDSLEAADYTLEQNFQTAAYTLVLADRGKVVEINSASALALTVPTNATVAFPVGSIITVRQYGVGQVTLTPSAGVTLNSRAGALKSAGQYAELMLTKRATDEWIVAGDTTL